MHVSNSDVPSDEAILETGILCGCILTLVPIISVVLIKAPFWHAPIQSVVLFVIIATSERMRFIGILMSLLAILTPNLVLFLNERATILHFMAHMATFSLQAEIDAGEKERVILGLKVSREKNAVLEQKLKMSNLIRSTEAHLTKKDLERSRLELQCYGANILSEAGSKDKEATKDILQSITKVQRRPQLSEAWTNGSVWKEDPGGAPRFQSCGPLTACLAVTSVDGKNFNARYLRRDGLGKEVTLRPRSHAFVQMAGEPFLRVAIQGCAFGQVEGHTYLSDERPVLYAGEIEFNQEQVMTRWRNMSAPYQCPDSMAFQAGLPLAKFYSLLTNGGDTGISSEIEEIPGVLRVEDANGHTAFLHKILNFTEEDFITRHHEWLDHLQALFEENPEVKQCGAELHMMAEVP